MSSLLNVSNLTKSFGGLKAVNEVSFTVVPGTIKSVIGPNGAGKTTLFNLISGFLTPDSGRIEFRGYAIQGEEPHHIAGKGIARTFQHIRLFPKMTVLENTIMGRYMHTRTGFLSGMLRLSWTKREARETEERCHEILSLLGIDDLAGKEATSLAYGQQRVVELSRALACEPALLLLDEPAAGLNVRETETISELIDRIRHMGVTILIVEHDMSLVMNISDEILVLSFGQTFAEGVPSAIQKNDEVIRVYLGENDAQS